MRCFRTALIKMASLKLPLTQFPQVCSLKMLVFWGRTFVVEYLMNHRRQMCWIRRMSGVAEGGWKRLWGVSTTLVAQSSPDIQPDVSSLHVRGGFFEVRDTCFREFQILRKKTKNENEERMRLWQRIWETGFWSHIKMNPESKIMPRAG